MKGSGGAPSPSWVLRPSDDGGGREACELLLLAALPSPSCAWPPGPPAPWSLPLLESWLSKRKDPLSQPGLLGREQNRLWK